MSDSAAAGDALIGNERREWVVSSDGAMCHSTTTTLRDKWYRDNWYAARICLDAF